MLLPHRHAQSNPNEDRPVTVKATQIGTQLGEVAPDSRTAHRNGYRERMWETRAGEIELAIPKT